MARKLQSNPAPGASNSVPHWQTGDKSGVGTSGDDASRVWFTTSGGIITEVFYPNVDKPQVRDLQLLFADGKSIYHSMNDFDLVVRPLAGISATDSSMGVSIVAKCRSANYGFKQEVITESHSSCLLVRTELTGDAALLADLRVYALIAPHIDGRGADNSAYVIETRAGKYLGAYRDGRWLLMGTDCGFGTVSCGFVGLNDGWQDIIARRRLPLWNYDCALNGVVAMTGEIRRAEKTTFVLSVAFGEGDTAPPNSVVISLTESLAFPFEAPAPQYNHKAAFLDGWQKRSPAFTPSAAAVSDGGALFRHSRNVLISHEDKTYLGALVASLSLPWGDVANDADGGYHMVWPRDMCQSATALLAANEFDLPLRGLMFLAASQLMTDGSFSQKFYLDGQPLAGDVGNQQLDEYSFPIILAWRLRNMGKLAGFDPTPMVIGAAYAIVVYGPMTQQERWEEAQGYSPSTLAANIASLVCASEFVADAPTRQFLLEYADFLETHLEAWCVTTKGSLLPAVKRHYIRLLPTFVKKYPLGDPNRNPRQVDNPDTDDHIFRIANVDNVYLRPRDVIDGGYLELARYGIRPGNDPLIEDSNKVADAVLRKTYDNGAFAYLRYNGDGYGQYGDGRPFSGQGLGHPWPLLAGERGHYELLSGRDPKPYVKSMETLAGSELLLPEQSWELRDVPGTVPPLFNGGPTGSSRPLAWAHAEYIRLVRSVSDGKVFDLIDPVVKRYQSPTYAKSKLEVWNFDRQVPAIARGKTLRVPLGGNFRLRWSSDGGSSWNDINATPTTIGVYYVDISTSAATPGPLRFTFFWLPAGAWNAGQDFFVNIV